MPRMVATTAGKIETLGQMSVNFKTSKKRTCMHTNNNQATSDTSRPTEEGTQTVSCTVPHTKGFRELMVHTNPCFLTFFLLKNDTFLSNPISLLGLSWCERNLSTLKRVLRRNSEVTKKAVNDVEGRKQGSKIQKRSCPCAEVEGASASAEDQVRIDVHRGKVW